MSYDPQRPNDVRPHNFKYDEVFYFDEEAAIMIGKYKGSQEWSVGMRWMEAEGDMGYPVSHGNPMWMVVPDRLALYMLEGIQNNRSTGSDAHLTVPHQRFDEALARLRTKLGIA